MNSGWYDIGKRRTICGNCGKFWLPIITKGDSQPVKFNNRLDQRVIVTCIHCNTSCFEWYREDQDMRMIQRSKL